MDTPIRDFVRAYAESGALRLHMPGHKGQSILGAEPLDITEIGGADVLYASGGIIRRSEENAAALFGTGRTLYSAEGSSLCIRAMLYLAALYANAQGKPPRIAAGRNAHKVFATAAALLDLDVDWIWPETRESLVSCQITPRALEDYLAQAEVPPAAVYLTSPDYLGNMADIGELSRICHGHGALLLVDNAHGAYLRFLPESRHPMDLGADLCCDSAHKTLPVLTGGAYLHISPAAPAALTDWAESAMALFASTSPSYLILQSLDEANRYLAGAFRPRLAEFADALSAMKGRLAACGYVSAGSEPLKLTLDAKARGRTGIELARELENRGIVCEFSDPDFTVMMLTPENGLDALPRLESALRSVPAKAPIPREVPVLAKPERRLSPRQALMAPSREVEIHRCAGKVLAAPTVSCPPAVPIVVCGEVIDETAVRLMEYYGIPTCRVVDTDEIRD